MAKYRFGDVVLVQFPFTDQSAAKKRPGVVVSSDAYHDARRDLVLMPITSHIRPGDTFGDVLVQNWREARLLMRSSIKPVFATLDRTLIIRVLGTLSEHDSAALRAVLPELLG
jgi:mRNA interferase MazF